MIKQILVPVNGSEHVAKAIEFAGDMAARNGATVHLLYVVKQSRIPEELEDFIRMEKGKDSPSTFYMKLMGEQVMGKAIEEAGKRGIKSIEKIVIPGDPAECIVDYAKRHEMDMIVLGTRELGSVSVRVLNESDQICVVVRKSLLEGKRVLVVDDERDVLETLEDLLDMCEVVTASSFEEGKRQLETQDFDLAVLDIMGVNGYELLHVANKTRVIPVMLTAHALSVEDTERSYREGAASYVPKEKMSHIVTYLTDVLEAREKGKHFWWRWLDRFGDYYEKKFGSG